MALFSVTCAEGAALYPGYAHLTSEGKVMAEPHESS